MLPDKWLQLYIVRLDIVLLFVMFYVPHRVHTCTQTVLHGSKSEINCIQFNYQISDTAICHILIKSYCTNVRLQLQAVLLFTPS